MVVVAVVVVVAAVVVVVVVVVMEVNQIQSNCSTDFWTNSFSKVVTVEVMEAMVMVDMAAMVVTSTVNKKTVQINQENTKPLLSFFDQLLSINSVEMINLTWRNFIPKKLKVSKVKFNWCMSQIIAFRQFKLIRKTFNFMKKNWICFSWIGKKW